MGKTHYYQDTRHTPYALPSGVPGKVPSPHSLQHRLLQPAKSSLHLFEFLLLAKTN